MNISEEFEARLVQGDGLLAVGKDVVWALEFVVESAPVGHQIALGFLRKAVHSLEAIQLLARNNLFEECQILTRAVFELRVTFEMFARMLAENPRVACERVLDAMVLDKIRQLESVDYYQDALEEIRPSRADWKPIQTDVFARYPKSDLNKLKRHGFTGLSVEERCRQTNNLETYNTVYRNFSRNTHSTDYAEQFGADFQGPDYPEYLAARNRVMLGATYSSVHWIVHWVNNLLGEPVELGP